MHKEYIYNQMTNAEREVAKLLKDLGIKWYFEQSVFVWDENKRSKVSSFFNFWGIILKN